MQVADAFYLNGELSRGWCRCALVARCWVVQVDAGADVAESPMKERRLGGLDWVDLWSDWPMVSLCVLVRGRGIVDHVASPLV
jgi:hypothetical protein